MSKFKPGVSGNPLGKEKGTLNRRTKLAELLVPHAVEILNKVVEMAKNGDINALKICVERLVPKIKNETIDFQFSQQDLNSTNGLLNYGTEIISAVTDQKITPEQGQSLISIIETQRKLIETADLARRLTEMEHILKQRKSP